MAAFALLALLLIAGTAGGGANALAAKTVSTPEERAAYLESLGWQVDVLTETAQTIHIPEEFSQVFEAYNDLQRQQGFDLADYQGQDCTLYSYAVTNYPDASQNVVANLYVYKNRVIGGDVHSTSLDGFMVGIR